MDMRVWVGCLGCYNAGGLVGTWVDAAEADTVTIESLAETMTPGDLRNDHLGLTPYGPHEELWCLDQEGLSPFIEGECSPMEAQRLAEQVGDLDDHELRMLRLYVEALGRGNWSGDVDWFDVGREAVDHYVGEAASLADWAADFAEETGALNPTDEYGRPVKHGVDEVILRNIDWAGVAQEWTEGYSIVRDDETGNLVLFSS